MTVIRSFTLSPCVLPLEYGCCVRTPLRSVSRVFRHAFNRARVDSGKQCGLTRIKCTLPYGYEPKSNRLSNAIPSRLAPRSCQHASMPQGTKLTERWALHHPIGFELRWQEQFPQYIVAIKNQRENSEYHYPNHALDFARKAVRREPYARAKLGYRATLNPFSPLYASLLGEALPRQA